MSVWSASQAGEPLQGWPHPGIAAKPPGTLASAVSWGSITAGAAAAAALSPILLVLGVGLGLSSVSPWARDGISATSFGVSTILWLTLTQLLASAMGGYLAGRLRTRWTEVHSDEVYFRDTAHGFLAWAVASQVTAALLTSTGLWLAVALRIAADRRLLGQPVRHFWGPAPRRLTLAPTTHRRPSCVHFCFCFWAFRSPSLF